MGSVASAQYTLVSGTFHCALYPYTAQCTVSLDCTVHCIPGLHSALYLWTAQCTVSLDCTVHCIPGLHCALYPWTALYSVHCIPGLHCTLYTATQESVSRVCTEPCVL